MTNTEINTIANALKVKQSWVFKGFNGMLEQWAAVTGNMENIGLVKIGTRTIDEETAHHVYLVTGKRELHFREENQYELCDLDYYIEDSCKRDELTIGLIRWAAPKISDAICDKFKAVQGRIDALSKTGQELARITNCLKK